MMKNVCLSLLAADPYCIVKYEGRKIKNHHIEDTLNPEWNDRVTLYRKKPYEDIIIEVYCYDEFFEKLYIFKGTQLQIYIKS